MSASLNDLPDLCLLAVFQYLPLLSLLGTIRLVSTRWSSLLPTALNRRRSLVIVGDRTFDLLDLQLDQYGSRLIEHVRRDDALTPWARLPHIDRRNVINRNNRYPDEDDEDHHPLHNQIPPEMITTLVDSLPQINSLTVVQQFFDLTSLDQIVRMIDHWRGVLISLKLYLKPVPYFCISGSHADDHKAQLKASTLALFDSINRFTSLKHLTLKFDTFFLIDHPFEPPLTILSQLSTFHIESLVLDNYPTDALVRYASGNRDLQISTVDYKLQLEALLEIDQQFCDRFVVLEVDINDFEDETIPDFNRFCTQFRSLVHLTLTEFNLPITRLAQCLSQLNQLVHLFLHVYTYPLFEEDNELELEVLEELPLDQIVTVPSVRLLSLTLNTRSHHSTEQLHLPELFPNVQVFSFSNVTEECPDCGFVVDQMTGNIVEITPRLRRCAQLARRPFRHFPLLHTIEIDTNDWAYLSASSNDRKFITRDEL